MNLQELAQFCEDKNLRTSVTSADVHYGMDNPRAMYGVTVEIVIPDLTEDMARMTQEQLWEVLNPATDAEAVPA